MTTNQIRTTVRKLRVLLGAEVWRGQSAKRRAQAVRLWLTVSGTATAERLLTDNERWTLGAWYVKSTEKA